VRGVTRQVGLGREQREYVWLFSGCMREGEVHGDVRVQAMCVCVCVYMEGDMCGVVCEMGR